MSSWADLVQPMELRWIQAFAIAAIIGFVAYRLRALTISGMVAATVVGGSIAAAAGWWPGVVLVTFFVTASALSRLSSRTATVVQQARGKRRDAVQVVANGGIPAALAAISAVVDQPGPWLVASLAAIAGATSDTWGTETGRLSKSRPRMVTTWKSVAPGTSGAVSSVGTAGSLAGAMIIGLVAATGYALGWFVPGITASTLVGIIAVPGFCGSLIDSLLGATAQANYRCPACGVTSEESVHTCCTLTIHVKGVTWLNNDAVNLLAIAGSAAIGLGAGWIAM